MNSRFFRVAVLAALPLMAGLAGPAGAAVIDLTTSGSSANRTSANGVQFSVFQMNQQPTGTGVIDPFVRIQENTNEHGYNTNASGVLDNKAGIWTHAIRLQDIPEVTLGDGLVYRRFALDINESNNPPSNLLTLNQIQIFGGSTDPGTSHTFSSTASASSQSVINFGPSMSEVFRLNTASDVNQSSTTNNTILLNYDLNHGSGSGDMYFYVNTTAFAGLSATDFIVLYSHFGTPPGIGSNAGFEEWWVVKGSGNGGGGGGNVIPVPPTAILAVFGIAPFALRRLRRRPAAA